MSAPTSPTNDLIERFMSKVDITDSCWLWTGTCKSGRGYGQFWLDGRMQQAHRVSYRLFVGEIAEGMTIDHVWDRGCRNINCVNPGHLEQVTQHENNMRGGCLGSLNAQKSVCDQGHDLTGENLYSWVDKKGRKHRHCRRCRRDKMREYRAGKVA